MQFPLFHKPFSNGFSTLCKHLVLCVLPLLFVSCAKVWHTASEQPALYSIDPQGHASQDSSIIAMIAPFKMVKEQKMGQMVGELAATLFKKQPEGSLGNWMVDILHRAAVSKTGKEVDFAIINDGGIRLPSLEKGKLTVGNIYELMPFDNTIVVVEIPGAKIKDLFDHIAKAGRWPVSWPVWVQQKNDAVHRISIDGKNVEETKMYRVAMPDFIANGGEGIFWLRDHPRDLSGMLFRDAIIEHVRSETAVETQIEAPKMGRWQIVDSEN